MARISVAEAQAWAEPSKLPLASLDPALLAHVEALVIGRVSRVYADPALTWVDTNTTPQLIRTLIAMKYVSLYYDRQYSEDNENNAWARRLDKMYEATLESILDGTLDLPEVPGNIGSGNGPEFYPTDASSASAPTPEDRSLGPAHFSMSQEW